MDRTEDYEKFIKGRVNKPQRRYIPLDETTSLVTKIYKMKSHLTKYGHDYLNTYGCLPGACVMTEERRNKLDADVENFIDSCHEKLKILHSEILLNTDSQQVIQHREAVIRIVKKILNDLFSYFNLLKVVRSMRETEKERYNRLEICDDLLRSKDDYDSINEGPLNLEQLIKDDVQDTTKIGSDIPINSSVSFDDCRQQSLMAAEHHTSIDPAEIQILAQENSRIQDELITFEDEVKMIGKKVVQIGKLQQIFTEKVMEQQSDLDNVHATSIKSSEDIRDGNDLIIRAMMTNGSTRVFMLTYIVGLALALLFLNWYHD